MGQGILKRTGALYESLEAVPGKVAATSALPYASYHHKGTRRIPARPLWPARLPQAWSQALGREGARALGEILARLASGGRP